MCECSVPRVTNVCGQKTTSPYPTGLNTDETDPCVKELRVTYCHIFIKTNNIIKKKTSKVQKISGENFILDSKIIDHINKSRSDIRYA